MYVRDAKNRDEVWLLDRIEEMGLDDVAFRSRDYVIAVDEESDERAGFGRLRLHKVDDAVYCELTGIGVLDAWRGQGVGAHVVERLVDSARDEGLERVYSFTDEPGYLGQFGFEAVDSADLPDPLQTRLKKKRKLMPDAVATCVDVDAFGMPDHLRESFKSAGPREGEPEETESPEDFGIDPDTATYKYDTDG
jgi:N-acetylglutamate synthase-like GNAT family acetyltransferase